MKTSDKTRHTYIEAFIHDEPPAQVERLERSRLSVLYIPFSVMTPI
jgi:hypothetical protein